MATAKAAQAAGHMSRRAALKAGGLLACLTVPLGLGAVAAVVQVRPKPLPTKQRYDRLTEDDWNGVIERLNRLTEQAGR